AGTIYSPSQHVSPRKVHTMAERTVKIASASGLHARPAGIFAQAAAEQPATVTIEKPGGNAVQASSMLMLMTLGAGKGDEGTLRAEGEGAEEAVAAAAALLEKALDAGECAPRGAPGRPVPGDMPGRRTEPPDTSHQRAVSGVSMCVSPRRGTGARRRRCVGPRGGACAPAQSPSSPRTGRPARTALIASPAVRAASAFAASSLACASVTVESTLATAGRE